MTWTNSCARALGGHSRKGSEFEWEIGPVQAHQDKSKNDFEESFGSLAAILDVKKYETHVEVRPKRKLSVRELIQAYDIVRKQGGKVGDVCEFGAWFTVPLADHKD